ncbi:hypothetical protein HU200_005053 [Digitaria exilis]|uniref:Uncharacterized protein n=1 Tax=Digitaria exilis TaxID=1010633 RepID=A0A835FSK4_9POAL|nr:hypothetical protein HU200_005053 [Digitaria exilis]
MKRDWMALPEGILFTVFLKLGPREIFCGVDLACTAWRHVAVGEPTLWRRLDMGTMALSRCLAAVHRAAGHCESLAASCDSDASLLFLIRGFPRWKNLEWNSHVPARPRLEWLGGGAGCAEKKARGRRSWWEVEDEGGSFDADPRPRFLFPNFPAMKPSSSHRHRKKPRPSAPTRDADWTALPHDILFTIFLKLGPREILRCADHVCTAWRRVAVDEPSLWRHLDMGMLPLSRWPCWRAGVRRGAGRCESFAARGCCDASLLFLVRGYPLLSAITPSSGHRHRKNPRPSAPTRDPDWTALPHDILFTIFLNLGPREILRGADHVCTAWRRVAVGEPSLWRHLDTTKVPSLPWPWWCAGVRRGAGRCESFAAHCYNEAMLFFLPQRALDLSSRSFYFAGAPKHRRAPPCVSAFPWRWLRPPHQRQQHAISARRKTKPVRRRRPARKKKRQPRYDYETGRFIAEGAYGVVGTARDLRTGEMLAIKRIIRRRNGDGGDKEDGASVSTETIIACLREADCLAACRGHHGVVQFKNIPPNNHASLRRGRGARRREAAPGGGGEDALHTLGMIHRDINPDKILAASDGKLKICGFGYAIVPDPEKYKGTLQYRLPDQLVFGQFTGGPKDAIWTCGLAWTSPAPLVVLNRVFVTTSPHPANRNASLSFVLPGDLCFTCPQEAERAALGSAAGGEVANGRIGQSSSSGVL